MFFYFSRVFPLKFYNNLINISMKQFYKFLLFSLLMLTMSIHAQISNNSWAPSFGFNVVDTKVTAGGSKSFLSNAISDPLNLKEYWNVHPSAVYFKVARSVGTNLTVDLQGSFNKIGKVVTYSPNSPLQNSRGYVVINPGDVKYFGIDAGVRYSFMNFIKSKVIDPSFHLGGGFTNWGDTGFSSVNGGAGLTFWFNKSIGLAFDSTFKKGFGGDARSHLLHTAGVIYQLEENDKDKDGVADRYDACPNVKGLKELKGCPDTDGDGITDGSDTCPDVFGLAILNGCPDSDGDGVADKDDECPNAKGLSVYKGCPDADNDGIVDKDDKCPTVAGLKANGGCPFVDTDNDGINDTEDACPKVAGPESNKGCPEVSDEAIIGIKTEAKSIYFNSGETTFKSAAVSSRLDAIALILSKYPSASFTIEGHTDNEGTAEKNQILSEERANVVKEALIYRGVSASKLTAIGYGSSRPIATNTTPAGKALNRRTEVILNK